MAECQTIAARTKNQNNRPLPPATLEQELAWITQYDGTGEVYEEYICAARYKAVYGVWPDGEPAAFPHSKDLHEWQIQWLLGQSNPNKWEETRRKGKAVEKPQKPAKVEAFPGQTAWQRQHRERIRRENAERRARSRKPARIANPLASLIQLRTDLREWFLANLAQASHEEWAAKFLELREIEQRITAAESSTELSRTPGGRDIHLDDRMAVTPFGHTVPARRMLGVA